MEKYLVVNHQDGAVLLNTQDGTIKPYNSDADIPRDEYAAVVNCADKTCCPHMPPDKPGWGTYANVACTF